MYTGTYSRNYSKNITFDHCSKYLLVCTVIEIHNPFKNAKRCRKNQLDFLGLYKEGVFFASGGLCIRTLCFLTLVWTLVPMKGRGRCCKFQFRITLTVFALQTAEAWYSFFSPLGIDKLHPLHSPIKSRVPVWLGFCADFNGRTSGQFVFRRFVIRAQDKLTLKPCSHVTRFSPLPIFPYSDIALYQGYM